MTLPPLSSLWTTNTLFGETQQLSARRQYQPQHQDRDDKHDGLDFSRNERLRDDPDVHIGKRHSLNKINQFLFGFMYEDENEEDGDDVLYRSTVEPSTPLWNRLNLSLFGILWLLSTAEIIPVTLVVSMCDDFVDVSDGTWTSDATTIPSTTATSAAARLAAAAVLGTSMGKLINGPLTDVWGARRSLCVASGAMAVGLVLLATAMTLDTAAMACFLVEYAYAITWPCCVVILATHYRGNASGMYEGGIYVTSLASRLGALTGIPLASVLLRHTTEATTTTTTMVGSSWRLVALLAAWIALVASSVVYFYVADTPSRKHQPQNPLDPVWLNKWFPSYANGSRPLTLSTTLRLIPFVVRYNLVPSMKHVLRSGTFWMVALAHTGSSMVRTSERLIGTYLSDTSNDSLSHNRAGGLAVFLSLGTVIGLLVAGNLFATLHERARKRLVTRLYILTISACYVLALLAIPAVRNTWQAPELVTTFQVMAVAVAGFGIAVQFYHIPGLVGATFGCDKGLFAAYVDGVAYLFASYVWRLVIGKAVQDPVDDDGLGWAYGWAAVALLLILSAVLMVEFMEHYFCRSLHQQGGTYETIIFA